MRQHWFLHRFLHRVGRQFFAVVVVASLLSGCSRDPNVRKQKYLESGQRYFDKAKYPEAAIQFTNAIQIDPAYTKAHFGLAQTYIKTQNWPQAYHELSRTLDLDPENHTARLEIANLLIAAGDFKQAQEHVAILSAHRPNDSETHVALAKLHAAQGELGGAVPELQKAISLNPSDGEPYLDLAFVQLRMNQFDSAEENFKKAVESQPTASSHLALGRYYQSRKRFAEAEKQYRQAIEADPKSPDARGALAGLYMAQNKIAETIEVLKKTKQDLADDSVGYRMLGDYYFARGDFDNAVAEYESLYKHHPKDLQVKKNFIQLLLLKDRLVEARTINDEILKSNPKDIECLIYRGQIQTRDGHPGDAVATLQSAIKNDPENGVTYYHLGNAFARMGNLRRAEGAWGDAVRLRPNLVDAHRSLAGAAIRKGDMFGLERAATKLIEFEPSRPDGYALRALSFTNRKLFAQAEADAAKAMAIAPGQPAGYIQMGNARMAQRKFKDAEASFQQALVREPASADALQSLMQLYLVQNQPDKAVTAAKTQTGIVPSSSALRYLLGTFLFDRQDLDGAEAAFKKSVELDRNNTDALLRLGQVQLAKGLSDEALGTCQRALQDNPRDASFLILMGQAYEARKDPDRAQDAYRKALEIAPENPLASNNLAYSMLQSNGNKDIALSFAQIAKRGLPDSPNAADTLGWAFYHKGAYRSAIDAFRESLKLAENNKQRDDPAVHYHLALAYEKSGQHGLARQQLERVLKIDPSYSKADEVRRLLSQISD